MLGSILRNLSINAVKFTANGGKISISAKTISDESVEISVRDTGIGMKKELIANLFRLDGNANRKGTDGEPSTGLGLILSKEFVEKHGGMMQVESVEGEGSVFSFTIPFRQI
jgi:signal transduction histidine kinase